MAVCFGAAAAGSLATTPNLAGWYAAINKSPLNPPGWVFGPVWTLLYLLMAISAWLVWKKGLNSPYVKIALFLFLLQLLVNVLWSVSFFGLHSPALAFGVIIILWLLILFTIIYFFKVNALSGWLMVPYILWVSFASFLNLSVALLNR